MTYAHIIEGKNTSQIRELDLALLGPEGQTPEEVGRANAEAMAALGQVGAVPTRRRKQK